MPQLCKVCRHPDRERIEGMILSGQSALSVSKSFSLRHPGVYRHMKEHCRRDLAKATEASQGKAGSALLDRIHDLADQAKDILQQAKEAGSLDAANGAIGQSIRALELIGRITGEVPSGGTSINVALGVRMDVAQQSVTLVKDAQAIEPREVIERALRCIRAWNAANPQEQVFL